MFDPFSGNPWQFNPLAAALSIQNLLNQEAGTIATDELKSRYELPDSRYIEVQGMQVHYRDVGSGPVLLLLHGLFASLHTWQQWTDLLSDEFRVISLDLPNFGLTGPHPRGMYRHMYSDFLADFTTALDIPVCAVAGNSLGGWMAWEYAARFPQRVSQMILLDSAGFTFVPPPFMMGMSMPGGGWLYARTRIPKSQIDQMLESVFFNPALVSADTKQRYYDMFMGSGNRTAAARVMRYIRDNFGFETTLLASIRQPVLIQWGANDPWMPVSHASRFAQALAHSDVRIYEQCGHLVMEEQASLSARDCRHFLKEIRQS
jgi:pimeloyl-ACP methyl ester carboxylesterase